MDYLDDCRGYIELKNKGFEEEFGNRFKEIKRYKLHEFTKNTEMIMAAENQRQDKKLFFYEQKDSKGENEYYKQIWIFDRFLTELQFRRFMMDYNQETRTGKEKYFYDNNIRVEEWIKSRFNNDEQYFNILSNGVNNKINIRIAIRDNGNKNLTIFYQYDDSNGVRIYNEKDFKDIDKQDIKEYVTKRMYRLEKEMIFKSGMLVNLIEKEIENDSSENQKRIKKEYEKKKGKNINENKGDLGR